MIPSSVLSRYGAALAGLRWQPVATAGFSGASVWRGDDSTGGTPFALKAYPLEFSSRERLAQIHAWLFTVSEGSGRLRFVPRLLPTFDGAWFVEAGNRFWEVATWQPGHADFHQHPTRPRLEAACAALAKLHNSWAQSTNGPMPGIQRRLQALTDFDSVLRNRAHPPEPRLGAIVTRAIDPCRRLRAAAEKSLTPWLARSFPLQPCLCDIWHDHVLFTGDVVTGVIDYGAMKIDHVAVDLARLLGSLVPGNDVEFAAGLAAYRAAGGRDLPTELVRLLADTGILCAVIGWLIRIHTSRFERANLEAILLRMEGLVAYLERCSPARVIS